MFTFPLPSSDVEFISFLFVTNLFVIMSLSLSLSVLWSSSLNVNIFFMSQQKQPKMYAL